MALLVYRVYLQTVVNDQINCIQLHQTHTLGSPDPPHEGLAARDY